MSKAETEESIMAAPPRSSKAASRASEEKWGAAVMKLGFCIVPSLLLRAQRRLKLNPTQLAVLMQLCDYWWDPARKPYPSKESLAQRLGLSARQLQRHIADLEQADLVKRIPRKGNNGGKLSNTYDLSGLVARLQKLEPEFRAVEEKNRKRRDAVSGFQPRAAAAARRDARSDCHPT
jgi:DNA-binding transcriptional ArsR family regulator